MLRISYKPFSGQKNFVNPSCSCLICTEVIYNDNDDGTKLKHNIYFLSCFVTIWWHHLSSIKAFYTCYEKHQIVLIRLTRLQLKQVKFYFSSESIGMKYDNLKLLLNSSFDWDNQIHLITNEISTLKEVCFYFFLPFSILYQNLLLYFINFAL